jgi:hypothetical protein
MSPAAELARSAVNDGRQLIAVSSYAFSVEPDTSKYMPYPSECQPPSKD